MAVYPRTALPERLTIARWESPSGRHRPDSPYVRLVWLGIIGPTSTWAFVLLSKAKDGWPVSTDELAATLGVGHRQLQRAVARMAAFNIARFDSEAGVLHVRTALPDVPPRLVPRLSPLARLVHNKMAEAVPEDSPTVSRSLSTRVWR